MALPNPGMVFTPFDPLPASDLNDIVENVEALADGTGLDDGAVIPDKLQASTGTTWVWQSWTPSWTNVTVGGGGSVNARYTQIGKAVFCELIFTYGAGSSISGLPTFTLPVPVSPAYTGTFEVGGGRITDAGTSVGVAAVRITTSSTASVYVLNTATAYVGFSQISSTVPMTWANTDSFMISFYYQGA